MRNDGRGGRVLRSAVVAATTTFVTAVAHTAAGGPAPSPAMLALAAMLSLLAGLVLVGRRMRLLTLVPAVAVAQALLHFGFSGTSALPATASGAHAEHSAHAAPVAAHGAHDGGGMLLAHVLSGLLTLVVLEVARRGVTSTLAALGVDVARLLVLLAPEPAAPPRAPLPSLPALVSPRLPRLSHALVLRGPPRVVLAPQ